MPTQRPTDCNHRSQNQHRSSCNHHPRILRTCTCPLGCPFRAGLELALLVPLLLLRSMMPRSPPSHPTLVCPALMVACSRRRCRGEPIHPGTNHTLPELLSHTQAHTTTPPHRFTHTHTLTHARTHARTQRTRAHTPITYVSRWWCDVVRLGPKVHIHGSWNLCRRWWGYTKILADVADGLVELGPISLQLSVRHRVEWWLAVPNSCLALRAVIDNDRMLLSWWWWGGVVAALSFPMSELEAPSV